MHLHLFVLHRKFNRDHPMRQWVWEFGRRAARLCAVMISLERLEGGVFLTSTLSEASSSLTFSDLATAEQARRKTGSTSINVFYQHYQHYRSAYHHSCSYTPALSPSISAPGRRCTSGASPSASRELCCVRVLSNYVRTYVLPQRVGGQFT